MQKQLSLSFVIFSTFRVSIRVCAYKGKVCRISPLGGRTALTDTRRSRGTVLEGAGVSPHGPRTQRFSHMYKDRKEKDKNFLESLEKREGDTADVFKPKEY